MPPKLGKVAVASFDNDEAAILVPTASSKIRHGMRLWRFGRRRARRRGDKHFCRQGSSMVCDMPSWGGLLHRGGVVS